MHPRNRCLVTLLVNQISSVLRDGVIGIVINLTTRDDGQPLIKQASQTTNHAGFGLTTLSQKDHVMSGQNCILELRHDGVFVTKDSIK